MKIRKSRKHSLFRNSYLIGGLLVSLAFCQTASSQAEEVFNSSEGFSDLQGANGWSYAGVLYSEANDLAQNEKLATFIQAENLWRVQHSGGVEISQFGQSKSEGNATFSLRYWTADQNYKNVRVTSLLRATTTLGAYLAVVDGETGQTKRIGKMGWATDKNLEANGREITMSLNAELPELKRNDRIYFVLQNSGTAYEGLTDQQAWDQTITATPAP